LLPVEVRAIAQDLLRDFPAEPEGIFSVGEIFDYCGQSDEAIRCWEHCLAVGPSFGKAHSAIATIASRQGDFEEAARHLQQAKEVSPELASTGLMLGKTLLDLGRPEEAMAELERQAKAHPASKEWFWLGQAHFQLQRYEQAKECYEKALASDQAMTEGWFGLMQVCERLGETDRADRCRQRYRELDKAHADEVRATRTAPPNDESATVHACNRAGKVYYLFNKHKEAEAYWRKAAELNPLDMHSRESLTKLLIGQGRGDEAIVYLEAALILQPTNLEALSLLTQVYNQTQNIQAVEECLLQVLDVAPDLPAAQVALAKVYFTRGKNLPEARKLADRAARMDPSGENFYLLSALCLATEDRAGAREALHAALRIDPRNPKYIESAKILENP
jgi:tetratricopeptide (TPR) repeat protein